MTHPVTKQPTFRCGSCGSQMHREHGLALLSCVRCDVIVEINPAEFSDEFLKCTVVPRRSPMIERAHPVFRGE